MGTSYKSLDLAEDRGSFSKLLQENDIPYPDFGVAETADEALALADELDFPILVRPSYVLGGQGMKIVINKKDLEEHCCGSASEDSKQQTACWIITSTGPLKRKQMPFVTVKRYRSLGSWNILNLAESIPETQMLCFLLSILEIW